MDINEKQFGFRKGVGTTDAIFTLRQLQEKKIEENQTLYCGFVDLEKAYDRVQREVVFWALRKKGVQERIIRIVESMYDGGKTCVRTREGYSTYFEVKVGLQQGSALNSLLLITIVEVITEEINGDFGNCCLQMIWL